MYRVSSIKELTVNTEDKELYDIKFNVFRVSEHDPNQVPVEGDTHGITKHQKEIRNFIRHLIKLLNNPLYMLQLNITQRVQELRLLINSQINVKIMGFFMRHQGQDQQAKATQDLKQSLENAILILLELDTPALWSDDQVVGFFEISMFNFYKHTTPQNILKQGWVMKKAGGRPNKMHACQHVFPCFKARNYSKKWFILTSQYMCYVETPFPKHYQKLKIPQNLVKNISTALHHQPSTDSNANNNNNNKSTNNSDDEFILKEVMLIDSQWEMMSKHRMHRFKITVLTNNRLLKLKFYNQYEWTLWKQKLSRAMIKSPWNSNMERFAQKSFAPLRRGNRVKILIDGEVYFRNMAEELSKAQSEIFISGWWLVDKYYMVRPVCMENEKQYEHNRLDNILLAAAQRGVKIYIVQWAGSKFAVAFDTQVTKRYLTGLHPNIRSVRHPKNAISLWSHHAKLCLIDQSIVFVGGLDICYGRWDQRGHPLQDITNDSFQEQNFPGTDYINDRLRAPVNCEDHTTCSLKRGTEVRMPFHDVAICLEGESAMDFSHHFVELWNNAKLDKLGARNKSYYPSITTRDKVRGALSKMIIKKGDNIKTNQEDVKQNTDKKKIRKDIKLKKIDEEENEKFEEELQAIVQKNINLNYVKSLHKSPKMLHSVNNKYFNSIQNIFKKLKRKPHRRGSQELSNIGTKINLEKQPQIQRMGTENVIEPERDSPTRQVLPFEKESHFFPNIQEHQAQPSYKQTPIKENITHNNQEDSLVEAKNLFDEIKEKEDYSSNFKEMKQCKNMEIDSSAFLNTEDIQILMHNLPRDHEFTKFGDQVLQTPIKRQMSTFNLEPSSCDSIIYENCAAQALRSACAWSLGLLRVEHSIYEAYIQLIEQSKKLIFIQNQFFMTCNTAKEENFPSNIIKNKIGLALRERILRAHFTEEEFQVIVFIPLMPGFSGDVTDSIASILRIQIAYVQETISRGKTSLIELLKADGVPDPFKYIKFFSLRAHTLLEESKTPIEEIIYIHAKLLIVDDKYVVLGSANLNDRSMLGSRDHELGIFISQPEKEDQIEIQMGSQKMVVSKLAHAFRTELMMEHWGFTYDQVKDPLTNVEKFAQIAENNSRIFFEIFLSEPDDSIKNFKELVRVREERENLKSSKEEYLAKYMSLKDQIQGHIVLYPTQFLMEENLNDNFLNTEIIIPEKTFV